MTDRPIIFSAPMIRALLDGRKTQTRRLVKIPGVRGGRHLILPPEDAIELESGEFSRGIFHYRSTAALSGPYKLPAAVGDRLWVREAIVHAPMGAGFDTTHWPHGTVAYLADGRGEWFDRAKAAGAKSRPSIHMPRWASRLTLIVEGVKAERLQEISEADAIAEGIFQRFAIGDDPQHATWTWQREGWRYDTARLAFAALWTSIHGPDAWAANPLVAVISFRVIRANIDSKEERA